MHLLGTIAMILVLSLMIAGLLKLNYKDLWVSEDKTSREPEARTEYLLFLSYNKEVFKERIARIY